MTLYQHRGGQPCSRVCRGYDTTTGSVPCSTNMCGTPTHKKRCGACAVEHDKTRRTLARSKPKPPHPKKGTGKLCLGFETDDGVHACSIPLKLGRNQKRCASCAAIQRKFTSAKYNEAYASESAGRRGGKKCPVCWDMPDCREPGRMAGDDMPVLGDDGKCRGCRGVFAPFKADRVEPLHSSMGANCSRMQFGR